MKKKLLVPLTLICSILISTIVYAQETKMVFYQNKTSIRLGEDLNGAFRYESADPETETPTIGFSEDDGNKFLLAGSTHLIPLYDLTRFYPCSERL